MSNKSKSHACGESIVNSLNIAADLSYIREDWKGITPKAQSLIKSNVTRDLLILFSDKEAIATYNEYMKSGKKIDQISIPAEVDGVKFEATFIRMINSEVSLCDFKRNGVSIRDKSLILNIETKEDAIQILNAYYYARFFSLESIDRDDEKAQKTADDYNKLLSDILEDPINLAHLKAELELLAVKSDEHTSRSNLCMASMEICFKCQSSDERYVDCIVTLHVVTAGDLTLLKCITQEAI